MTNILFPTATASAVPESADIILIADSSDSNNPKDCTLAELPVSTLALSAINAAAALAQSNLVAHTIATNPHTKVSM